MSEEIVDCCGYLFPAGVQAFVATEAASAEFKCTYVTSPAPYASDVEVNCLKLDHDSGVNNIWDGHLHAFTAGDVYLYMGYFQFQRVGGWPNTNSIKFLALANDTGPHVTLRLKDNGGATPDLEILDTGGVIRQTGSNPFPELNRHYLVKVLIRLDNSGEVRVRIYDTTDGTLVLTVGVSGYDFLASGNALIKVMLQGEGGNVPISITTVYNSSWRLSKSSATSLFVASRFTEGNFCLVGSRPTKASATPDCDILGDSGGDDLDLSTTWDNAGYGHPSRRASYSDIGDDGAVKLDIPSEVTLAAVLLAGTWVYLLIGTGVSGDIRVLLGREDDSGSGYTVLPVNPAVTGSGQPFHVVKDINTAGTLIPEPGYKFVVGFKNQVAGAPTNVHLVEAGAYGLYEYPLRVRQVNIGETALGGGGRIAYAG